MDFKPEVREPVQQVWFRAKEGIGSDPHMHQVILAYASDMNLLSTAMRPHGVHWQTPQFQSASLDHAMWFHRPFRADQWLLYDQVSPSAAAGLGFSFGRLFAHDRLAASCAQEGLIRLVSP